MNILLLAEHRQNRLAAHFPRLLTAARQIGGPITVLVAGEACLEVAYAAAQFSGVTELLLAEHASQKEGVAENLCALLLRLAPEFTHFIAPATPFGRHILPRLAASLQATTLTEIIGVIDATTFIRPIHAGNAHCTLRLRPAFTAHPLCLTVRPTSFAPTPTQTQPAPIQKIDGKAESDLSRWIDQAPRQEERPHLNSAQVVIAGGGGMEKAGNFDLITEAAHRLGAAVGATRTAVDAGLAASTQQIGQTGQIIAPKIYIAAGISGAIQHLAGIKDAKTIFAINNDPHAPIHTIADFSLTADLFTALPEILQELDRLQKE
ncbi:MAG: FAD-binding protein [Magnetococcus sp. DMHC-6]